MNEKQQQLTFDKGITNVPSDILCSDNALEESVGMIYDNGEHRVIQKPVVKITGAPNIVLYIHKFGNEPDRYICTAEEGQRIVYGTVSSGVYSNLDDLGNETYSAANTKITSIGKTLIVTSASGIHYYLWQPGNGQNPPSYKYLGDHIPEPYIRFWLYGDDKVLTPTEYNNWKYTQRFGLWEFEKFVSSTGSSYEILSNENYHPKIDSPDVYNDLVVGLYAKNKKQIAHKKCFCNPFFVRYALEMYDGTYTYISNPVLLMPSCKRNSYAYWDFEDDNLSVFTCYKKLFYEMTFLESTDLTYFSDIVKDVVVFISDGIELYDTVCDQPCGHITSITDTEDQPIMAVDGIYRELISLNNYSLYHDKNFSAVYTGGTSPYTVSVLKEKSEDDILNDIKSVSVFYKICSLGLKQAGNDYGDLTSRIPLNVLDNLTTQEIRLNDDKDDYFSRSKLYPSFIYAYNSRLNLANVARSFFEGFEFFIAFDKSNGNNYQYTFDVTIQTDTGNVHVWHNLQQSTNHGITVQGVYFYYPDSRAKHVVIYNTSTGYKILDADLETHSGLNGAFYIAGLPGYRVEDEPTGTPVDPESYSSPSSPAPEKLPNYIITSEVNNPWVFQAEGYNRVGVGEIIGMSTTTMALSQDQFGGTDLIVFTDNGIWGMKVDGTGLYQSIHPFSREVCNNPKSITQTDGAVFFSSEKGLMIAWDGGVKCVSEQLNGKESLFSGEVGMGNFRNYMEDCFIAYDYRDSLLWIFNNNRQTNPDYCYVYSIKTGTFGKFRFDTPITNVVNDYPDYLLQTTNQQDGGLLLSLTGRTNINLDDADDYSGLMITRPMKLENGLALKSIMQIRNISYMEGSMTLRIFASNNLNDWVELHSLRGMPWKYYRFRYDLSDMKATDRFGGSVLITQERRTNKLR